MSDMTAVLSGGEPSATVPGPVVIVPASSASAQIIDEWVRELLANLPGLSTPYRNVIHEASESLKARMARR